MKILNLYAGIGGNRKLWTNVNVTAVEINPEIAKVYQDFFPEDKVIVGDAHEYLLQHFKEFDFIWSSPPCPTHSDMFRMDVDSGNTKVKYPDMNLYQEIILLAHFFKGKYVVENVISYYNPLLPPQESHRHYFWANFNIQNIKLQTFDIREKKEYYEKMYQFDLNQYTIKNKRQLLRNMVNPKLGLYVFNCAFKIKQTQIFGTNFTKSSTDDFPYQESLM